MEGSVDVTPPSSFRIKVTVLTRQRFDRKLGELTAVIKKGYGPSGTNGGET